MLSQELLAHYRQLSQKPLTVVDIETTGKFATTDRITELSVLQATLADGILQQKTTLINPQTKIPVRIIQFTGITQKMVDAAPTAAEVLSGFLPLLSTGVFTAHNIEFDYPFLQTEYGRLGTPFDRPDSAQLCTVQLSRLMLPDLPSRSLPNLVKHFQFNVGKSHRAAADTLACWLLAERLLTEILQESDQVLLTRFARQWIPLKVAAQLLDCAPQEAQTRLAGCSSRFVGRGSSGTLMYKRGDVERLYR